MNDPFELSNFELLSEIRKKIDFANKSAMLRTSGFVSFTCDYDDVSDRMNHAIASMEENVKDCKLVSWRLYPTNISNAQELIVMEFEIEK